MPPKVHDQPSKVFGEFGEVIVEGPGGVAVSLTPKAAREMSDRLRQCADEAEIQLSERAASHRPRRE
jgi:hypothetical protein